MKSKPSICFVAHNAYGALADIDIGHIGGVERQQSLMAKWFAKRGYQTSMVTWDVGQGNASIILNVKNYKICKENTGVKLFRFIYPRWVGLNRALSEANADIYYYNSGDLALGQIVLWAKIKKRCVIYSVASDVCCYSNLPALKVYRERILFRYGLKNVDQVIVQTQQQKILLKQQFNIDAKHIPMPSEGANGGEFNRKRMTSEKSIRILWIGRLSKEKRLEWLLDVAEQCPNVGFDVIGSANINTGYATALMQRAKKLNNVILHGRVMHKDIGKIYSNATILCSTSEYEGFPNVFLEAWSIGIPVFSTVDPDKVISSNRIGKVIDSVDRLKKEILELTSEENSWEEMSEAASIYFENRHTVDNVMPKFERLFKSISEKKIAW